MKIKSLEYDFSFCKTADISELDFNSEFTFFAKTDEEISLFCKSNDLPANCTAIEEGWRAFRIEGELDFSLIGILAGISGLLAKERIGICAVSTFNTDYFFVKKDKEAAAIECLCRAGYELA